MAGTQTKSTGNSIGDYHTIYGRAKLPFRIGLDPSRIRVILGINSICNKV